MNWSRLASEVKVFWTIAMIVFIATIQPLDTSRLVLGTVIFGFWTLAARPCLGTFLKKTFLLSIPGWLMAWPLAFFQEHPLRWVFGMTIKVTIAIASTVLLVESTPVPRLLAGMKGLGVPSPLIAILSFFDRYLRLVIGESERMQRAWKCRSVSTSRTLGITAISGIAAHLFVRGLQRSDRIFDAMLARGYSGHFFVSQTMVPLRQKVGVAVLVAIMWGIRVYV